jgi:hypothetical protein
LKVEAIKFIKEEIENFGGDPNKITLFGESAGSMSISFHTYSPLSQSITRCKIKKIFFENFVFIHPLSNHLFVISPQKNNKILSRHWPKPKTKPKHKHKHKHKPKPKPKTKPKTNKGTIGSATLGF